jgi:hypothetical protein
MQGMYEQKCEQVKELEHKLDLQVRRGLPVRAPTNRMTLAQRHSVEQQAEARLKMSEKVIAQLRAQVRSLQSELKDGPPTATGPGGSASAACLPPPDSTLELCREALKRERDKMRELGQKGAAAEQAAVLARREQQAQTMQVQKARGGGAGGRGSAGGAGVVQTKPACCDSSLCTASQLLQPSNTH